MATPKSKSLPLLSVRRAASKGRYCTGNFTEERRTVLRDLKHYRQVPYKTLVCEVLGSVSGSDLSELRGKLTDAGLLQGEQWASLVLGDSKKIKEHTCFQPLDAIISQIFKHAQGCSFFYASNPFQTPMSSRNNLSRPDAYIVRSSRFDKSKKIHWFDVAIPFEFKKSRHDAPDNECKMIWSLHNIMCEDPLRRFALGITIEHSSMRVWYHSRSLLIVSEAIDLTREIDNVISLFYLIAQQAQVGLGWDPTIERINVRGKIQYRFQVGDSLFTTTRALATHGADVMVGSGTRVYEAIDESGKKVAIKDSWREEDREKEGDIVNKILQDIREKIGEEARAEAERHFVRVHVYGDVYISGELDQTFHPGQEGSWIEIGVDEATLSTMRHIPSTGHIPGSDRQPTDILQHLPHESSQTITRRVHTRTVFRDVGRPLMEVSSLLRGMTCLYHALLALYYVHKAGWVYQDFGVANVLWVDGEEIGKLTDFEFAKKAESPTSHEVQIGTMYFMAVEVEAQRYLFPPQKSRGGESLATIYKDILSSTTEGSALDPPFRTNFFHDLESLWWATLWLLFHHTGVHCPTKDLKGQQQSFDEAFPSSIHSASRAEFLSTDIRQSRAWETLSVAYKAQVKPVVLLGAILWRSYQQLEAKLPELSFNDELLGDIYGLMRESYHDVVEKLKKGPDVILQPLFNTRSKKRKRGSVDSPTRGGRGRGQISNINSCPLKHL